MLVKCIQDHSLAGLGACALLEHRRGDFVPAAHLDDTIAEALLKEVDLGSCQGQWPALALPKGLFD